METMTTTTGALKDLKVAAARLRTRQAALEEEHQGDVARVEKGRVSLEEAKAAHVAGSVRASAVRDGEVAVEEMQAIAGHSAHALGLVSEDLARVEGEIAVEERTLEAERQRKLAAPLLAEHDRLLDELAASLAAVPHAVLAKLGALVRELGEKAPLVDAPSVELADVAARAAKVWAGLCDRSWAGMDATDPGFSERERAALFLRWLPVVLAGPLVDGGTVNALARLGVKQ